MARRLSLGIKFNLFGISSAETASLEERAPLVLERGPPRDWFLLTYIILYLHGVGHLLPWNMFITAHSYFSHRFTCDANTTGCHGDGFGTTFESWFAIAAMVPVLITTAANIYLQSKILFQWRMLVALVIMLVLFALTVALVEVNTSNWVNGFFSLTLTTIVVMNLASGMFQSSTFGFAGILPQKYTAAVMSGQAFAGIFSAVARIISTLASSSDVNLSALLYFLSAVVVILICLVSFFILVRLKFVQYYMIQTSVRSIKAKQESLVRGSVNEPVTHIPFIKIFQEVAVYAISVFMVFAVTLSLFPAVISSISSSVPDPSASLWTTDDFFDALVCFLIFNLADFTGRYLSTWFRMPGYWQYLLLVLTIVRIAFVPFFLFCNVQPRATHLPVFFVSDIWPIAGTLALGLTNGFLASMAMVSAPQCVRHDHRETASTFMTMFLALGLLVGASFSYLLVHIVR